MAAAHWSRHWAPREPAAQLAVPRVRASTAYGMPMRTPTLVEKSQSRAPLSGPILR
jgi:hypothetical protein